MNKPMQNISKQQSHSIPDHLDFWYQDDKSIIEPLNLEDPSTSIFSLHFITPEKEDEHEFKEFKLKEINKPDLSFTSISKEPFSCFVTPSDKLAVVNTKADSHFNKTITTDIFPPELFNIDIGSLELLKLVMIAKSTISGQKSLYDFKKLFSPDINMTAASIKTIDDVNLEDNSIIDRNQDIRAPEHDLKQVQNTKGEKTTTCKCNKSKCLKLYCECFAAQKHCGSDCGCQGCYNSEPYNDLKQIVIKDILDKNPKAFNEKFKKISKQGITLHSRGCNCKRSGCSKKYCECYAEGLKCTNVCKCQGCDNCGTMLEKNEIKEVHEVVKRKRKRKKPLVNLLIEKLELVKAIKRFSD